MNSSSKFEFHRFLFSEFDLIFKFIEHKEQSLTIIHPLGVDPWFRKLLSIFYDTTIFKCL